MLTDLPAINQILKKMTPIERIQWANEKVSGNMITTTSGGKTSRIIPDLLNKALKEKIPTIFVDTGFYSKDTYNFVKKMKDAGVDIHCYGSNMSPWLIESMFGKIPKHGSEEFDAFLKIVKHDPLNNAFRKLKPKLWIRGIMHYQTNKRKDKDILEYKNNIYHLHPIIDWDQETALKYIRDNKLPINEKHYDMTKGKSQKFECNIGDHCGVHGGDDDGVF